MKWQLNNLKSHKRRLVKKHFLVNIFHYFSVLEVFLRFLGIILKYDLILAHFRHTGFNVYFGIISFIYYVIRDRGGGG